MGSDYEQGPAARSSSPHAIVLPYPAQGHVIPLMELSHRLVQHGFKITFVVTEFDHRRLVAAEADTKQVRLVSIPDGLGTEENRNDLGKLTQGFLTTMPGHLEELIRKTNDQSAGDDKITCMIADSNMAWALHVAKRMGIRPAAFCPTAAQFLALSLSFPKLIEEGIIHENGLPRREEMFRLAAGIPPMSSAQLPWNCLGDLNAQKILYNYIFRNSQATQIAEFIICNSFYEIESPVFAYAPNILPVGPLRPSRGSGKTLSGGYWPEDKACISWLDKQLPNSVIYVAFGSTTILDKQQFQQLCLGLELTNKPFLWVVRPDLADGVSDAFPDGFMHRVAGRGKMVGWSPQQQVLSHPSIACFMSHCGWNSTMDGVSNGVPFLCWPYFGDQFMNQSYICDVWRTGLRMTPLKCNKFILHSLNNLQMGERQM